MPGLFEALVILTGGVAGYFAIRRLSPPASTCARCKASPTTDGTIEGRWYRECPACQYTEGPGAFFVARNELSAELEALSQFERWLRVLALVTWAHPALGSKVRPHRYGLVKGKSNQPSSFGGASDPQNEADWRTSESSEKKHKWVELGSGATSNEWLPRVPANEHLTVIRCASAAAGLDSACLEGLTPNSADGPILDAWESLIGGFLADCLDEIDFYELRWILQSWTVEAKRRLNNQLLRQRPTLMRAMLEHVFIIEPEHPDLTHAVSRFLDSAGQLSRADVACVIEHDPMHPQLVVLLDHEQFKHQEWLALQCLTLSDSQGAIGAKWIVDQNLIQHFPVVLSACERADSYSKLRSMRRTVERAQLVNSSQLEQRLSIMGRLSDEHISLGEASSDPGARDLEAHQGAMDRIREDLAMAGIPLGMVSDKGLDRREFVRLQMEALVPEVIKVAEPDDPYEGFALALAAWPQGVREKFLLLWIEEGRWVPEGTVEDFLANPSSVSMVRTVLDLEALENREALALGLLQNDGLGGAGAAHWLLARAGGEHRVALFHAWKAAGADSPLQGALKEFAAQHGPSIEAEGMAVSLPASGGAGLGLSLPEELD